jgi:hypothetical protein
MLRSLPIALALLAMPLSALATPTANPFECNVPIEALPASLREFRIVAERAQSEPSNLYEGRAIVYDPHGVRVLGREAKYLEMVQSGDVIMLSAFLSAPLEDVRSSVNDRAAHRITWVCSARNDCGAVSSNGLQLRLSTLLDERTEPLVVLSCTYNAGLRGLAPAL